MAGRRKKELTRTEFLKTTGQVSAGAALGLGALGTAGRTAHAAKKNTMIIGMTQEAVQYNPLLYVKEHFEVFYIQ